MGWFGKKTPQTTPAASTGETGLEPIAAPEAPPVEAAEAEVMPEGAESEVCAVPDAAPAPMEMAAPAPAAAPTPSEALDALKVGNEAFVRGDSSLGYVRASDLGPLQSGQSPIATIISCADSRTSPTILFNQGLGKLFMIRVAGNTVDRRGLASIVYAVKHLKCPLVVVMGHTGCGAVAAAEAIVDGKAELDPSLEEMIVPIIPAVLSARRGHSHDMAAAAVEENARRVAAKLVTADTALADAVEGGSLKIVAAVKDMRTGAVRFLED